MAWCCQPINHYLRYHYLKLLTTSHKSSAISMVNIVVIKQNFHDTIQRMIYNRCKMICTGMLDFQVFIMKIVSSNPIWLIYNMYIRGLKLIIEFPCWWVLQINFYVNQGIFQVNFSCDIRHILNFSCKLFRYTENEICHDAILVFIGGTGRHNDNVQCLQWQT